MTTEHFAGLTAINKFFYFSNNWVSDYVNLDLEKAEIAPTFLNAFPIFLRRHLLEKFLDCNERYGKHGAIIGFYGELDSENRRLFLDWILENYKIPNDYGIKLTDD